MQIMTPFRLAMLTASMLLASAISPHVIARNLDAVAPAANTRAYGAPPHATRVRTRHVLTPASLHGHDVRRDTAAASTPALATPPRLETDSRGSSDVWLMVVLSIAIVGAQLKRKQRLLGHRLR